MKDDKLFKVIVTSQVELLADEDTDIPGEYRVVIDANGVPQEHFGDAVLDVFHSTIAVSELDNFNFTVEDPDGNNVKTGLTEGYEYSNCGYVD